MGENHKKQKQLYGYFKLQAHLIPARRPDLMIITKKKKKKKKKKKETLPNRGFCHLGGPPSENQRK